MEFTLDNLPAYEESGMSRGEYVEAVAGVVRKHLAPLRGCFMMGSSARVALQGRPPYTKLAEARA